MSKSRSSQRVHGIQPCSTRVLLGGYKGVGDTRHAALLHAMQHACCTHAARSINATGHEDTHTSCGWALGASLPGNTSR
jgi:hypothetical protein